MSETDRLIVNYVLLKAAGAIDDKDMTKESGFLGLLGRLITGLGGRLAAKYLPNLVTKLPRLFSIVSKNKNALKALISAQRALGSNAGKLTALERNLLRSRRMLRNFGARASSFKGGIPVALPRRLSWMEDKLIGPFKKGDILFATPAANLWGLYRYPKTTLAFSLGGQALNHMLSRAQLPPNISTQPPGMTLSPEELMLLSAQGYI